MEQSTVQGDSPDEKLDTKQKKAHVSIPKTSVTVVWVGGKFFVLANQG